MSISTLPPKLWEHPDVRSTNIHAFTQYVNQKHHLKLADYHELWKWSTESVNDFWMRLWEFTAVKATVQPSYAISSTDVNNMAAIPKWFPEARLNYAQNLLESAYAPLHDPSKQVIIGMTEGGEQIERVSLADLGARVGRTSNALRRAGINPSDRVACIGANSVDTFVIFLAVVSIGAIFTCCSPETGQKGILDRFLQTEPKILLADDAMVYNGKRTSCLEKVSAVGKELQSKAGLKSVVVVPRFKGEPLQDIGKAQYLQDFIAGVSDDLTFTQTEFSHPMVIVYSSGTTGQPKCLVHTVGGILMKMKKEQILCLDMKKDSVYMQYSSTNWIMYLYAINGLLSGATSILYDGSPFKPSATGFLELLAKEGLTHFGTSAHYLSLLEAAGITKANLPAFERLKCITSTGSVLSAAQYQWIYSNFPPIHLNSMSGGTDIAGCFVSGAPNLPVYEGWCQARVLGMKVQVFSDDGEAIEETGRAGELVCTAPFPSQPAFFWKDKGGERYRNAYFTKFPNLWHQGDYIRMDPITQGIQFLGRSDGVLNPSGVRFGSAEIYNVLVHFPEIEDSLCVGQRRPNDTDEQVLLFVKMRQPNTLSAKFADDIRRRLRQELSPRHVPRYIFETPEIPMTVNGKKTEVPVKKLVCGEKVTPSSTIVNATCLEWYQKFVEVEKCAKDTGAWTERAKL